MINIFPLGIQNYIIGGLLVSLGIIWIFLSTGKYGGASTFLQTTISYFSKKQFFQQKKFLNSRTTKIIFTLGLVCGSLIYTILTNTWFVTKISIWSILISGFLVGFGTRYAKGCTSGHGICGTSSLSKTSIIAVIIFVSIAILTANIIKLVIS